MVRAALAQDDLEGVAQWARGRGGLKPVVYFHLGFADNVRFSIGQVLSFVRVGGEIEEQLGWKMLLSCVDGVNQNPAIPTK